MNVGEVHKNVTKDYRKPMVNKLCHNSQSPEIGGRRKSGEHKFGASCLLTPADCDSDDITGYRQMVGHATIDISRRDVADSVRNHLQV